MLSEQGDFIVNNQQTFVIGDKNKDATQIKGIPNSYLALDDIEYGFKQKKSALAFWLSTLAYFIFSSFLNSV